MKRLDLHGIRHEEVEALVYNFLFSNDLPVKVITGKSEPMQKIVKKIVGENGMGWHYERSINFGCLIVTNSSWLRE
jgi:hypothetical protein|tara:strand:- start:253 stop:480 length:228 start_codon:yes stop_codon:yes gene_type:complete